MMHQFSAGSVIKIIRILVLVRDELVRIDERMTKLAVAPSTNERRNQLAE